MAANPEEDTIHAMAEGCIDINGYKICGFRLYSVALIVLIPFVAAAFWVGTKTGDLSALKEIALIVVAFLFGKKSS